MSKTLQNLKKAFEGESQAYMKYSFYAKQAKKDGLPIVKDVFEETMKNEKEHAKIWFKKIKELDSTAANLFDAMKGELYESTEMYIQFAEEAREEGYEEIAQLFEEVADIEDSHYLRFAQYKKDLENDTLFTSEEEILWECTNCGHQEFGFEAPEECIVCKHPKGYFKKVL